MELYLGIDGQRQGPLTVEQVRLMQKEGKVSAETLAFQTGLPGWVRLSEINGVLAEEAVPPLPAAPLLPIPPLPGSEKALIAGDRLSRFLSRATLVTAISSPILCLCSGLSTSAMAHSVASGGSIPDVQSFLDQLASNPSEQNGMIGIALCSMIYVISMLAGAVFAIWSLIRFGSGYRLGWISSGIHAVLIILAWFF